MGVLPETLDLGVRPRAFHKLRDISQKVAQKLLKSCSKVAQTKSKVPFCNESCSKVAQKLLKQSQKYLFVTKVAQTLLQKKKKTKKSFVAFFLYLSDANVQQK